MDAFRIKKLSQPLLKSFDEQFTQESIWRMVTACVDRDFPNGDFTFLDLGGGNGLFADRILDRYSRSDGIVLDNSRYLLSRNKKNGRKRLVCASAESLEKLFAAGSFDIVFVNWVLHHLVNRSYHSSIVNMISVLCRAKHMLTLRGRISILENIYTGYPLESLPGFLIFIAASSKRAVPFTRRLGVHSAGIGVCFLSFGQWKRLLDRSQLSIDRVTFDDRWHFPIWLKFPLFLKEARVAHFWCHPED